MVLTRTIVELSNKLQNLKEKKILVFPEGWNPKIKKTISFLLKNNLCNVVLLVRSTNEIDEELDKDLRVRYIVVNEKIQSQEKSKLINLLYETRKHKGMTLKEAEKLLSFTNYYGTMLIKANLGNGYVGGIEYSTKDTLKPALQIIKTKKNIEIAGDLVLMEKELNRYIFTNCAVNISPTPKQLICLAYGAIKFANTIGIDKPKVAFLSYSTANSGIGEPANHVRETVKLAQEDVRFEGLEIKSELQFDSAISEAIRKKKAPNIHWEGSADVFIFPTLNAGNIGYKIAQQLGGYSATGPILIGLAKPMNDLSRGSTLQDIISTAIVTIAMAQDK